MIRKENLFYYIQITDIKKAIFELNLQIMNSRTFDNNNTLQLLSDEEDQSDYNRLKDSQTTNFYEILQRMQALSMGIETNQSCDEPVVANSQFDTMQHKKQEQLLQQLQQQQMMQQSF